VGVARAASVTFDHPRAGHDSVYLAGLPATVCRACGDQIRRREHRVSIRASWHDTTDVLCPHCWRAVCEWAKRFALGQLELEI
jgi:hypothetical protein